VKFPVLSERELLTTRSQGEDSRLRLEGMLAADHPMSLEVDFTGIEALTISFGDEFLGRLLTELQAAGREPLPLLITNLNEDTATELEVVLERRKLLAACRLEDEFRLLGGDRYLKATYVTAVKLGTATTGRVAVELKTSIQNINNRLRRLVAAGALERERIDVVGGGREFAYEVPLAFRTSVGV
jgi:hypothetical protein